MKKLSLCLLLAAAFGMAACSKSSDPVSSTSTYHVVPNGAYQGHTWGEWYCKWWAWALSMPDGANAVQGTAPMETNQSGDVWFLSGTFAGGAATRTITVPNGKALFISILNAYGDTTGGAPTASALDAAVQGMWDASKPTVESAEIDGQAVANVSTAYFATVTDFLNQNIPTNNVIGDATYGNASVTTLAASCGDYLMIDQLSVGKHTIHFKGSNANKLNIEMTYTVTVQ